VVAQGEIRAEVVAQEAVEGEVIQAEAEHLVRVMMEETQILAQAPVAAVEPGKLETQTVMDLAGMV
tara:strand:+ start:526 stop:723 length:198 start_codon:yes stop_codon:yes gene_type:complete